MIIYRTKYQGLLAEFAFLEGTTPTKAIILCEGLPTVPKRQETLEFLAQQGFLVFYPRYRGTWESEGEFLAQNPSEDIKILAKYIREGEFLELYADQTFSFKIDKIFMIGTSFGGSVVLESSALEQIDRVVALSPVVDFLNFNTEFKEQDLNNLGNFMSKAFVNGYRFKPESWQKLLRGEILNPAKTISQGSSKILILQNQDDTTVNTSPVESFAKQHKIQIKVYPSGGHFSFSKISKGIWDDILSWING